MPYLAHVRVLRRAVPHATRAGAERVSVADLGSPNMGRV